MIINNVLGNALGNLGLDSIKRHPMLKLPFETSSTFLQGLKHTKLFKQNYRKETFFSHRAFSCFSAKKKR